jgi:hypothetical protein
VELFNREEELVDAFTSKSNDLLKALLKKTVSRSFLIHEFNSYYGVADVVLGTMKATLSRNKKRESVNPNWITPLAALRRGERISLDSFCGSHGLSKSTARKYLNEYTCAGFLEKTEVSTYKVIKEYKPVTDLVVSVEAKLRDWKKALTQAQRYKRFSDLAFVLLDGAQSASAIKNIEEFRGKNIGLLCLTDDDLEVHFVPERKENKIPEYYLRFNEIAYDHYTTTHQSD